MRINGGYIVFLFIGLLLGVIINDVPYLSLEKQVGIGEVSNFILVLAVVLFLDKRFDNQRHIKNFLINEIRSCTESAQKIIDKIDSCYHADKKISEEDRKTILLLFRRLEFLITSLTDQLEISFEKKSEKMRPNIKNIFYEYKDKITGDSLKPKISPDYYRAGNLAFSKIERELKKCIHEVNKF